VTVDDDGQTAFWTPARTMGVVAGVILCLVGGYLAFVVIGMGPCGGDGGSPYAAPDSPRGRLCDRGIGWIAFVGPVVAFAAGAVVASLRRSSAALVAGAVAAVAVIVAPIVVVEALPNTCKGDDPRIPNNQERFPPGWDCFKY
jgi:hypothetical protein